MLQYQNDKSIFFHGLAQLHLSLTFPYLTRMGGGFGSTHSLQAAYDLMVSYDVLSHTHAFRLSASWEERAAKANTDNEMFVLEVTGHFFSYIRWT